MTEQLISFETAKKAKEKGFNWRVDGRYYWDYAWKHSKAGITKCDNSGESISTPTQSVLQRWLREVHNIIIDIMAYYEENQLPLSKNNIQKPKGYFIWDTYDDDFSLVDAKNYNTYEEALEIGLQEALKLIK